MHYGLTRLQAVLPESKDLLFEYIVELGETYAEFKGPHVGLQPVFLTEEEEEDQKLIAEMRSRYPDTDAAEFLKNSPTRSIFTDFRSKERLQAFIDYVPQILNWLSLSRHVKPRESSRRNSAAALKLIGADLPVLYKEIFGRKFGVSRHRRTGKFGPGIRFIIGVLKHAKDVGILNEHFSPETIIKYRGRAVERKLEGEPEPPPPPSIPF
jgi:hypothetical protein